jgi:hypothetical protein
VGEDTGPGIYRLNDDAHARLLDKLAERKFVGVSPDLRQELLHFFAQPGLPYATKRNPKAWARVQAELEQLKTASLATTTAASSQANLPLAKTPLAVEP